MSAMEVGAVRPLRFGGAILQAITTIGLDIGKSVFQVHGVDAWGNVILGRQLKRLYVLAFFEKIPSCLVGICPSSEFSGQLRV